MILRLALGIALGIKITQDSLLSWHTVEMVGIAIVLQLVNRRVSDWLGYD